MATNLKKSKKIRAFFYRMFAMGSFFIMIASAVFGSHGLKVLFLNGPETLTGQIYYLPEFKEYMNSLYATALAGYAGVVDHGGYPLEASEAANITDHYRNDFLKATRTSYGNIIYCVQMLSADGTVITTDSNSSQPLFSGQSSTLILPEDVKLCYYWNGPEGSLQSYLLEGPQLFSCGLPNMESGLVYLPDSENIKNIRLVIAIEKNVAYAGRDLAAMDNIATDYQIISVTFLTSSFLTVLFCLLSLFSKKAAKEAVASYARFTAKIWLEIKLSCLGAVIFLYFYYSYYVFRLFKLPLGHMLAEILLIFLTGCLFWLYRADLKQNGGNVFRNSLFVKLVLYIKDYILCRSWYRKAMTMCILMLSGSVLCTVSGISLCFLNLSVFKTVTGWTIKRADLTIILRLVCVLLIFAGILLLLAFIRALRFTKEMKLVADKLSGLQLGNPGTPLSLPRRSLLYHMAADINQLEDSIENAVEQKNRSNKMRVELITNVSHDLKTPLTSIINYADLLCEEPLSGEAAGYASALRAKAYRLKNMVQDVFELSKATSGNLPVEKQCIDLVKLIRQTLADMDERIQQSNLTFKTAIATEPIMIEADGEKLYRVFQNLFVNALQYSLDYSRVHVQLFTENGLACVNVKNTSKWELDFDTGEITERFVRADTSRTTEGSGLGLSIVQSFTEACGGTFTIETDADMFTACIRFPLAKVISVPDTAPVFEGGNPLGTAACTDTSQQEAPEEVRAAFAKNTDDTVHEL